MTRYRIRKLPPGEMDRACWLIEEIRWRPLYSMLTRREAVKEVLDLRRLRKKEGGA